MKMLTDKMGVVFDLAEDYEHSFMEAANQISNGDVEVTKCLTLPSLEEDQ
jgi:hypothetical protein